MLKVVRLCNGCVSTCGRMRISWQRAFLRQVGHLCLDILVSLVKIVQLHKLVGLLGNCLAMKWTYSLAMLDNNNEMGVCMLSGSRYLSIQTSCSEIYPLPLATFPTDSTCVHAFATTVSHVRFWCTVFEQQLQLRSQSSNTWWHSSVFLTDNDGRFHNFDI